ncbi:xanthine dehydrogenase family protein molybdopterin-binding subunit [Nonomuraea cavernae]|uniref:Aldehyde oxidase n=1 Tax=Nonomuraea cavernae TaxID=2045107 RepID=A0A917YYG6_9ACTN|nr:xanthine dehydrogenase family protein molybdopterin-binding subunit [Nonomuraea cavernae]MCA2186128.1 xanthine dehydrogenase family protein molybdopterin-binding subunit [Nonomuraea cavernae]GGO70129.1 aldehyde oxidase [Nonomuraea cavernae]
MSDVIGADLPRRDAEDKLRGRTVFTVDAAEGGLLHAALCRSEVPAGRIVSIDLEPARRMPGVRAVVSAADAPGRYGITIADHPLFAVDQIRYLGEPVAAVAAETLDQARAAASAIVVEVEEYTPLVTMAQALADDARDLHPGWEDYDVLVEGGRRGRNIGWEATVVRGDTDAAFARDDVRIVETEFVAGRQNQAPLEPRACVAGYENGRFVIQTSTQVPWSVRNSTARLLGVREADVRVVVPPVGGGFGMKFEVSLEPFAALLARAAGRPVKLVNSRQEEMQTALCRENAEIRIRSAVTESGEIVAREAVVLMDCGAYGGEQPFLTSMTAHTLGGNYRLGAVRLVSRAVYTNTPPNGAFRACNGTYCTAALERHTDEICAAIGMDRVEFRRRNVLGDGDLGSTGQVFEGDVLAPMIDRMVALRDSAAPVERADDGRLYGTATTVGTWFIFVGPSAATVNLNPDGTATLVTAGVEIGSGSTMQAIPQLVADSLGLRPEDVTVRAADTDAAGYDGGVGGGRTTVSLGAAGVAACDEVRRKVFDLAAEMLEASPDDLVLTDGHVAVNGVPSARITLREVAERAQQVSGPISGSGSFTGIGVQPMSGCAAGHMIGALDLPVFAVHECDVAVDPDTGHVEVLAYRVVQDVGRAINPRAVRGQVQGGVVQGLGYALHEEITIDARGKVRQTGFETYRMPLSGDVVPVQLDMYEGAPSFGPLGVKGAGEVPILNVAAAVSCAVADAIGRPVSQIPLTPQRVLGLVLGRESEGVELRHIGPGWRDNVIADPDELMAAAGV